VKDGQSVPASHGRVKHTDTQLDGEKKTKTIFLFSSIEKNKNKIWWVGGGFRRHQFTQRIQHVITKREIRKSKYQSFKKRIKQKKTRLRSISTI
jgi:hypothetical protein